MNQLATVIAHGNTGTGVAENMMSGLVHVKGNASQSAGATGHGGLLIIDGDAGRRRHFIDRYLVHHDLHPDRDPPPLPGVIAAGTLMPPDDVRLARPLSGTTVVVTRAASRAERLVEPLEALGAHVLTYAATRTVARDVDGLRHAAAGLARYDWVVFTSATAVDMTFDATEACGITADQWKHTRVAAVGSATASAVRDRGVEPALVPTRFVAEGLLDAFAAHADLHGTSVLHPAAVGARRELADGLRLLGATVHVVEAYETIATDEDVAEVHAALCTGHVNAVTLTAKSAVDAWVAAMGDAHGLADVVSIGPVTTQAARAAGMRVAAEAMPSTIEGLVAAVVRAVTAQRDRQHHQTNIS
jgi:uroporphyrinogen-III synthase